MSERVIDVVPNLVHGQKRDGRCIYDRRAKQELVRRCQQPGVSVAALALAHGLNANLLRKWITVAAARRGPACRGILARHHVESRPDMPWNPQRLIGITRQCNAIGRLHVDATSRSSVDQHCMQFISGDARKKTVSRKTFVNDRDSHGINPANDRT